MFGKMILTLAWDFFFFFHVLHVWVPKTQMSMEVDAGMNITDFSVSPCHKMVSYVLIETPSTICILFKIFLGSVCMITVCGNLLVITSIIYFKQLHSPTNALVLSLAAADLLVGALVLPLTMKFSMSSCLYNTVLFCKVRSGFDITLSTCSILNLCCISVDRYYAVCQPLTYRSKIRSHVIVIMVLICWGIPALVSIGLIGFNRVKCVQKCYFYVFLGKVLVILITFYLPLLLMLCIYLKIFLVAQKQARSIQNKTNGGGAVCKMQRKATKTLAIVMGVFLLCWLPSFLCTTILSFSDAPQPGPLVEILNWLALSNSMLNPFIYAFFYSWFRSAFRIIISGKIIFDDLKNSKLHWLMLCICLLSHLMTIA